MKEKNKEEKLSTKEKTEVKRMNSLGWSYVGKSTKGALRFQPESKPQD